MKIDFKDGSYIEFSVNENILNIAMCGKKADGTLTHSNSFIEKADVLKVIKFLLNWMDK